MSNTLCFEWQGAPAREGLLDMGSKAGSCPAPLHHFCWLHKYAGRRKIVHIKSMHDFSWQCVLMMAPGSCAALDRSAVDMTVHGQQAHLRDGIECHQTWHTKHSGSGRRITGCRTLTSTRTAC